MLAILATSYCLNRNDRVSIFYQTRGSKQCFLTCFSYFSRYFLILVFLQNHYLLISLRLSWLHGNLTSRPVSCTIGTPGQYVVHVPPCFWHRTCGFLEARRLWEPGSSLTTGEFSRFRLFPKVSAANIQWTEHDSYLSCNQVDCCLSYDSFLMLRSMRQCGPSSLKNPSQRDPQRTPAIWHASQSQSRRTSYLQATTSPTAQKCRGCEAQIVGADRSASLSCNCQGQVHKVVLLWYCFHCVQQSFYGTAFAYGFLVEKGRRSQSFK